MNKKADYEAPQLELIMLLTADIIRTSGDRNDIDEDLGENDGEWT